MFLKRTICQSSRLLNPDYALELRYES